jgi:hypothetical protein
MTAWLGAAMLATIANAPAATLKTLMRVDRQLKNSNRLIAEPL